MATTLLQNVTLAWSPVPGAVAYRIYHQNVADGRFTLESTAVDCSYIASMRPGLLHRYSVAAIQDNGTESRKSSVVTAVRFVQPWGVVVTAHGNILVRDAGYPFQILLSRTGTGIAGVGVAHLDLSGSFDIAVGPHGEVATAAWPAGTSAQQGFVVQSANLKRFQSNLRPRGTATGQVDGPMGIAVDGTGRVYVADTGNNRIEEYSQTGVFLRTIGVGQLLVPMKPTIGAHGTLYVADSGHNRIAVFAPQTDGSFRLAKSISGPKEPVYVVADARGNVFVSANREAGLQVYSPDGKLLWRYNGTDAQPLSGPRGLALDGHGNIVVADEATARILIVTLPPWLGLKR